MSRLLILLAVLFATVLNAPAIISTNILSPTFINTGSTNGNLVDYATLSLPPMQYIYSSAGLTNPNGANGSIITGQIVLSSTNVFTIRPSGTNNVMDSGSLTLSNINVTFTCTATNWGTNTVQFIWQHN